MTVKTLLSVHVMVALFLMHAGFVRSSASNLLGSW